MQAALVVAFVAVMVSYFTKPVYHATAKILIMRAMKGAIEIGDVRLSRLFPIIKTSSDIDVNKVLASSKPYLDEMVYKLQLRGRGGNLIGGGVLAEGEGAAGLLARFSPIPTINVTQFRETDILQMKASSPDSEEAMMMANTLADIMVRANQSQMRAAYKNARIFLEKQMGKAKDSFNKALYKITKFKKSEKTVDLETETKLAAHKLAELMKQKEDKVIDLAKVRAKFILIKEELAKLNVDYLSASMLRENPQIEALKRRLSQLRLEYTDARMEFTVQHPKVLSLKEQIRTIEAELKREIEVYRTSAADLVAGREKIAVLEVHLEGVNADIDKYLKDLDGMPDKAFKKAILDRELNVARQKYGSLLDALFQIGMAEASTLAEIRVVEDAVRRAEPDRPNLFANGLLGVIVGSFFGFGLALLLEYIQDTVKTVIDMRAFQPIKMLGAVPRFGAEENPLIANRDSNDPMYESYRKIRNYLTMNECPIKAVLVTSPGPGEGKSTTVANLGISVARRNKKAVIIDMDLRRAILHTYFGLSNDVGVGDLLEGKASTKQAIQATSVKGLSVISSGLPFRDPGGLIESDRFGRLISALKKVFDVVIVDSAPVLVKSDALLLAKYVDGAIIVLEAEKTTRRAVHATLEVFARAHVKPLGLILNRLNIRMGKYYYQEYYYGHHERELLLNESTGPVRVS